MTCCDPCVFKRSSKFSTLLFEDPATPNAATHGFGSFKLKKFGGKFQYCLQIEDVLGSVTAITIGNEVQSYDITGFYPLNGVTVARGVICKVSDYFSAALLSGHVRVIVTASDGTDTIFYSGQLFQTC